MITISVTMNAELIRTCAIWISKSVSTEFVWKKKMSFPYFTWKVYTFVHLYINLKYNDNNNLFYFFLACKGTAKLMYTGTLALGCKAYQDAQRNSCRCTSKNNFQDELWYNYTFIRNLGHTIILYSYQSSWCSRLLWSV